MRSLTSALGATTTVAALFALTACGSGAAETPAAESDQAATPAEATSIVLYAGRDEELIAPLVEQFTDETGIEVEVRYAGTTELNALLLEEGDKTPADVFLSQDAGALGALSKAGLLATLPDEIADTVPAGFTSSDASWIGVTGRARVFAYDGEALDESDLPDSVDALTDEEWAGRVGFPPGNASFQSFITALRVLEGEDAALEWAKGIADNDPVLTEKNGATLDLVNTGELDIALSNHYYWYQRAAEQGADNMRAQLKFLPGDAGGIVNVTGAGVLAPAEDNAAAHAFVEYLVSDAGQEYFVEKTYEYPLVPGIDAPEGLPAIDTLVNPGLDLSDLDSLDATQELLAEAGLL
ncbi:iron ABC transporter substrate-binding protein [Microbacterium amylolyticum]|uniref:Iron(III) transport system substrate-binding protein n=1 Tax=Microbacterium amylolyticum TaxID=936337 RepID=A0ABS4ZGD7_9MICO|nr:iron ABC transporter substrate-binding protein [Microbacterium amylolyticum]MBP2436346.1 iron(III) transport system substrate-binding protein [Microbacterium amylolyticum]